MAGDAAQAIAPASQRSLPTLDRLNAKVPSSVDAKGTASSWFLDFVKHVENRDIPAIAASLVDYAFWRDMLALTWDFRTFEGTQPIFQLLQDTLAKAGMRNLQLKEDLVTLQQPYPDILWIQAIFTFETEVGRGSGVFRLVPTSTGEWKAHTVYTNLEELKGYPERTGPYRNDVPNHGLWPEQRRREINFEDTEPAVIVIGGGQSGLEIAARLKLLEVPTLVIDRQPRIGDQWRGRYEALCLHDPVCKSQLNQIGLYNAHGLRL